MQKLGKTYILGYFIYRHHNQSRVHLYVPRKESYLLPLNFFTSTGELLQIWRPQERIYDYLGVHENRKVSDPWTGFTRFTLLNETLPERM